MKADGTLTKDAPWFGKTIIRSCAKLDYATAQRMIDGTIELGEGIVDEEGFAATLTEDIWEPSRRPVGQSAIACVRDVQMMAMIARNRRKLRLENGALVLTRTKLSFQLDETGNPIRCSAYAIKESNSLVEEYMLLANFLVAKRLVDSLGPPAFLRRHPPPSMSGLTRLKLFSKVTGEVIDTSSARGLQSSLSAIALRNEPLLLSAITALLTQPMQAAKYCVACDVSIEDRRHYALGIPCYTHFTSPIRRYADVIVHRLLEKSLLAGTANISDEELKDMSQIAEHCNLKKATSKEAQDRSDRIFLAVLLKEEPILTEGVVIDMGASSFTVLIPAFGMDRRMFCNSMSGMLYEYDAHEHVLKLRKLPSDRDSRAQVLSGTLLFDSLELRVMKKVKLYICKKKDPPIDVEVHLVE